MRTLCGCWVDRPGRIDRHEVDVAAEERGERVAGDLERHVRRLEPGVRLEELRRHLAGVRLRAVEAVAFASRAARATSSSTERYGFAASTARTNGSELIVVTGAKSFSGSNGMCLKMCGAVASVERRRRDEDGVAVGLGFRHVVGGEQALRAGLVLDDDRLARQARQLVAVVAHDDVGARARREIAHRADVARRIVLRQPR